MSRFRSSTIIAFVCVLLLAELASAQKETVYMSVLSSRRHRIGASDNPVVGLFVSTDGGATWTHRGWREYIRVFYTEPGAGSTVWSACGNGILRSTDGGLTWRVTTGWEVTEVLKVRAVASDPNLVYAATAYGVVRSTDGGRSWKLCRNGFRRPFTSDIVIDRSDSRKILATSEEGLYRSRDGGESWVPGGLKGKITNVIVQDPANPRRFWAGTEENGVFRSDDGGETWQESGKELSGSTVYALATGGGKNPRLYAGTYGKGVFVSSDGGTTWTVANNGLKNLDVHSLLVLPSNPAVVFAGTLNGGLYRSADAGVSWAFNSQEDSQVWGLSVGN